MAKPANIDRQEALAEAYRRGILPPNVKAAYEEAQRRGLVAGGTTGPANDAGPIDAAPQPRGFDMLGMTQPGTIIDQDEPEVPELLRRPEGQAYPQRSAAPRTTSFPDMGDRAVRGYESLKQSGVRGDLAGRALAQAADTFTGGIDFLTTPGRAADDALGLPGIVFDFKPEGRGIYIESADERKAAQATEGGRGLPKFDVPEATNAGESAADLVGQAAGFLAPGTAIHRTMSGIGNAAKSIPFVGNMLTKMAPKGSSAAARGGRYAQRMAGTIPESGVQAFAFGASTADRTPDEVIRDGQVEFRPAENPVEKGAEMAGNPLNYLVAPALSFLYRGAIGVKSGGRTVTPLQVRADVAPVLNTPARQSGATWIDTVPMPQGVKTRDAERVRDMYRRIVEDGGVTDQVMEQAVDKFNAMQGERPPFAVFLRRELQPYPKAIENLDNAIYEIGQDAPEVGQALTRMRTSQADRLKDNLKDELGAQDRLTREKGLETKREKIGDEYDDVLSEGPVTEESAQTLRALLNDETFAREIPLDYKTKLELGGIDHGFIPPDLMGGAGIRRPVTLAQRIQDNPLEVAHWTYSSLGKRIAQNKDPDGRLQQIQDALRPHLDNAGGPRYTGLRDQYAARSQDIDALGSAAKMSKIASSGYNAKVMRDVFDTATKTEKTSMRIAFREWIEDQMRQARVSNDFTALGKLEQDGTLDALKTILGDGADGTGTKVVEKVLRTIDERAAIKGADPAGPGGKERLAAGREAYAGKTAAGGYRGHYGMNEIAHDAFLTYVTHGVAPIFPLRLGMRTAQKAAAALATPSKSARSAFARSALDAPAPGAPRPPSARAAAAHRRARVNGRFASVLDPETPGPGGSGFDEEAFAASMTDDTAKIGGKTIIDDETDFLIDERYVAPAPKRISSNRPAVTPMNERRDDTPSGTMSPTQKYLADLRGQTDEAMREIESAEGRIASAKSGTKQAEAAAKEAEVARRKVDDLKRKAAQAQKKVDDEASKTAAAEERARMAAEGRDEPYVDKEPGSTPFSDFGRMRDMQTAKAGDPRALRDVVKHIVGEDDPAALQLMLQRRARNPSMSMVGPETDQVNRIVEVLNAAKGLTDESISPEVAKMVGALNKENKEWLVDKLSNPGQFDLGKLMDEIAQLPPKGRLETEYGALGPPLATAAGAGAIGTAGVGVYNSRDKRSAEHRAIDGKTRTYAMLPRDIKQAQSNLKRMGYYKGAITGEMDDETRKAIGVFTDKTGFSERHLFDASLPKSLTDGAELVVEEYYPPDEDKMRQYQRALNRLGYKDENGKPLELDGTAGPKWRHALRQFQRAKGLKTADNSSGLTMATEEALEEYVQ